MLPVLKSEGVVVGVTEAKTNPPPVGEPAASLTGRVRVRVLPRAMEILRVRLAKTVVSEGSRKSSAERMRLKSTDPLAVVLPKLVRTT